MNPSPLTTPARTLPSSNQVTTVPQLIKVEDICRILALQKSAVYELVAAGRLRPPLKLGQGRRSAARWLLSDVSDFVEVLANTRSDSSDTSGSKVTDQTCLSPMSPSTLRRPQLVRSQTST
jgi:predicted DNA-binding transcriptional regulator AlpA